MFKRIYLWWKDRGFWHLKDKTPESIFTEVYHSNTWGGEKGEFYSGEGTTFPGTDLYVDAVVKFIREKNISSVLELGCGDFRIMQRVLPQVNVDYTGMDVVKTLIEHNQKEFGTDRIHFTSGDISESTLPKADLIIIRQVLQHLNNDQIKKITDKLGNAKYSLITEQLPASKNAEPNLDKITGPHIRLKVNSGVFIDQPPFNVENVSILLEYREDEKIKGKVVPAVMRTYLAERT